MKKYPSKYSNGKEVSAAQFITEMICERIAKKKNKDLHFRFWISEEWQKEYKSQIGTANKLLKTYQPQVIINALKSDAGKNIYSLRAPFLIDILVKEQKKYQNKLKEDKSKNKKIERNFLNKGIANKSYNILDKLKDIDDGITR
jgi:hypothetical protein